MRAKSWEVVGLEYYINWHSWRIFEREEYPSQQGACVIESCGTCFSPELLSGVVAKGSDYGLLTGYE